MSSVAAPPRQKTLILIDGHSLAYRMHFALANTNMKNSAGTPTWAVYGFFNALFSLLKKVQPDAIAVSFDVGRITFRNEKYSEYKAHRESMPDEMRQQMSIIRQGIELLGIPIYEMPHYEADDVIGTLAVQAAKEGWRVQILTGDQDAFQLVEDNYPIEVLIPPRTPRDEMRVFNRQGVMEKWGITPEQVIDFKGLKGDSSDNIPGVPGIGDKTAVKLLSEYQTLENLYAHLDEMPANKLREKLTQFKDQAFLSKELATICREVPLPHMNFEDCHLVIPDYQALIDFFATYEFKAFLKQAPVILAPFLNGETPDAETSVAVEALTEAAGGALSGAELKVDYRLITRREDLQALAERIRQTGVFAFDVETTGLDVFEAGMAGIAVSVADGFRRESQPARNLLNLKEYPSVFDRLALSDAGQSIAPENVYIPIHQKGCEDCLPEADIWAVLRPVLEAPDIIKIVHNAKYEKNILRNRSIHWQGLVFDTMIASYVDNPDRKHGLKSLCQEVLGETMCEIKTLIGSGKSMIPFTEVPIELAAPYAAADSHVTLRLAEHFLKRLNPDQTILLYEIELPLAQVLADMEWEGVALDREYLSSLSQELDQQIRGLERAIYELAGCEFNLNSPKQVGEVLFEKMGLTPLRKTKGKTGFSTDVKVLEQLAEHHEIVRLLLEYRQLFKLKSTYIDALPQLINPKTGRIHTSFNQTVTATGRLSSSNPNLQNIPIRSELGRLIRKAFIPGKSDGWSLLSADYSQIELRLLAHFSEDPNLVEAFRNNEDVHTATAALVFGMAKDKVTKEQRYRAKTVNFGVVYGQSAFGLANELKIPQAEAAEFIKRYFVRYPAVKGFIDSTKAEAHKTGEVQTICGRSRNLAEGLQSTNKSVREFSERAAFNTPLQGSAADLMKVAMIRLQRKLQQEQLRSKMILQVHDELVLEVPEDELKTVKRCVEWAMALDQPLKVPLEIDVHVGPSWMET